MRNEVLLHFEHGESSDVWESVFQVLEFVFFRKTLRLVFLYEILNLSQHFLCRLLFFRGSQNFVLTFVKALSRSISCSVLAKVGSVSLLL